MYFFVSVISIIGRTDFLPHNAVGVTVVLSAKSVACVYCGAKMAKCIKIDSSIALLCPRP